MSIKVLLLDSFETGILSNQKFFTFPNLCIAIVCVFFYVKNACQEFQKGAKMPTDTECFNGQKCE